MLWRPVTDLKARTITAMKWTYFSTFTATAIQLLFSAILSRLVTPEQFGITANAFILQRLGQFIGDLGIGQALVQKAELTQDDIRAGLTASVALGIFATALAWVLAPLAGQFYNSTELVAVFRGFACAFVVNSFVVIARSLLARNLRFRAIVMAELTSYVLGHGVVGLGTAYLGFGAMSLAYSTIAQSVITMVLFYAAARHTLRPIFRISAYRPIFAFSVRVTVVNFLEFLSQSLDSAMIGRLYGLGPAGLYNRTYGVLASPASAFGNSLTRVLAPSFSAVQHDRTRLAAAYHGALHPMSLLIFSAAGCFFVYAPEIVRVMLGPNFPGAVELMQIFALFIPFAVLTNLSAVLAEATAHLRIKIRIQAVYFVLVFFAFYLTYRLGGGIEHFAMILVAAGALRSLAYALVARRILHGGGRQIAVAYALGIGMALAAAGACAAVVVPLRALQTPLPILFGVEALVGFLILVAVVLLGPANELQRMARQALLRLRARVAGTIGGQA